MKPRQRWVFEIDGIECCATHHDVWVEGEHTCRAWGDYFTECVPAHLYHGFKEPL